MACCPTHWQGAHCRAYVCTEGLAHQGCWLMTVKRGWRAHHHHVAWESIFPHRQASHTPGGVRQQVWGYVKWWCWRGLTQAAGSAAAASVLLNFTAGKEQITFYFISSGQCTKWSTSRYISWRKKKLISFELIITVQYAFQRHHLGFSSNNFYYFKLYCTK